MRFAHISDLHLCSGQGAGHVAQEDVFAVAEALAKDIARIGGILDFIAMTGDLTDDGRPESFRQFEQLFAPLGLPIFAVPGNHDGPAAYFREASGGFLGQCDITGRVVDLGAVRLLGLDTCVENETGGALSAEDLDLVTRELASDARAQLLILMHHPPFTPGLAEFDEIARLEGAGDMAERLQAARAAPILLCGHVHRIYQARWCGASCFVAGSPPLPFTSKLPFGDTPIHPSDETPCYHVHSVDGTGNHVVTPQPLPRGPGA